MCVSVDAAEVMWAGQRIQCVHLHWLDDQAQLSSPPERWVLEKCEHFFLVGFDSLDTMHFWKNRWNQTLAGRRRNTPSSLRTIQLQSVWILQELWNLFTFYLHIGSKYIQAQTYTYTLTIIWSNVSEQVVLQSDIFGSQQAPDMILAGYLTVLLNRTGSIYLNWFPDMNPVLAKYHQDYSQGFGKSIPGANLGLLYPLQKQFLKCDI